MNELNVPAGICLTCGHCFYPPGCLCRQPEEEYRIDAIPIPDDLRRLLQRKFKAAIEEATEEYRVSLDRARKWSQKYVKRIEELEEYKADIENSHKMIMDEKCSGDQEHCSCVPLLRDRVEELERALANVITTISNSRKGYAGDHYVYVPQISERHLDDLRAAAQVKGDDHGQD